MANDLRHGAQQTAPTAWAAPAPPPAPPPAPAIDPGAWPVIRRSAARLVRNEEEFIRQLHYDITGLIPEGVVGQGLDMWVFSERLVQSLLWVALTDQPEYVVVDTLRQIGARNWYEGFPDAQYPSVAHALVQTVHYLSGNDWSASTGSAWISFFMWVRPHLLAGSQLAAAQHAAEQEAAAQQEAAQRAVAEQEAARVAALSRDPRGGHSHVVGDVNLEKVASLLDDDDDEGVGYGQIMLNMTRNSRRDPPKHE
jgi:hypothetical protein